MLNNSLDTNPSCKTIQRRIVDWTLDHPPLFVPVRDIHPTVSEVASLIQVFAANVMNNKVRTGGNAVYVFAYNRVMTNDMRGRDWAIYAEACVKHTWINLSSGNFASDDDAIIASCETVWEAFSCSLAYNTSGFNNFLSHSEQNYVINKAQEWQEFQEAYAEATNVYMSSSGTGVGQGHRVTTEQIGFRAPGSGGGTQQRGMISAPVFNRPASIAPAPAVQQPIHKSDYTDPFKRRAAVNNMNINTPPVKGPRVFDPGAVVAPKEVQQPVAKPETNFGTVQHIGSGNNNIQKLTKVASDLTIDDWLPSSSQPFHPVLTPTSTVVYERLNMANGGVGIVAVNQEIEMDASRHVISTAESMFGKRTPVPRAETIEASMTELGKAIANGGVGENETATRMYALMGANAQALATELPVSYSVEQMVTSTRVERMMTKDTREVDVGAFLANTTLAQCFVTSHSEEESLEEILTMFAECKTFTQLADIMQTAMNAAVGEDIRQALLQLEVMVKENLTSFIQLQMGQCKFMFDSFVDDAKDIPEALEANYGKLYKNYYMAHEAPLIALMFAKEVRETENITRRVESDLTPINETDPVDYTEEVIGSVITIKRFTSVVLVDSTVSTFGITVPVGVTCQIHQTSFAGLYELLSSLYKKSTSNKLEKFYLVLADNTKFEVGYSTIAAVNNSAMYTIRMI